MQTETSHEDALDQVESVLAESIRDDLRGGNPDGTHAEWLWAEVDRVLSLRNKTERADAIEDTTIADLIACAAKSAANRSRITGHLDAKAREIAGA